MIENIMIQHVQKNTLLTSRPLSLILSRNVVFKQKNKMSAAVALIGIITLTSENCSK